jgi:hypothetical protein
MGLMRPFLALALCFPAACGAGDGSPEKPAAQNKAAVASIEIVDLAGLERVLTAHRGRAVVLNLWAMW